MRGGKFNGKGLLTSADGSVYEGDFSDGYKHGEGVLTYGGSDAPPTATEPGSDGGGRRAAAGPPEPAAARWGGGRYCGHWRIDARSGEGVEDFPDGSRYVGAHHLGRFQGQGVWRAPNGVDGYSGVWFAGERNGQGTETDDVGVAVGEWADDYLIVGVLTFHAGGSYSGEWQRGKYHGPGVLTTGSGYRFKGSFVRGREHGEGTASYPDGTVYTGPYVNGEAVGFGSLVSVWGTYTGEVRHRLRHGRGRMAYVDGSHYEGEWGDDERRGRGVLVLMASAAARRPGPEGSVFWRYEGEFVDVFEGEGRLEAPAFVHTGGFSQCVRHGRGRTEWYRGRGAYDGEFALDLRCGQGQMVYGAEEARRTGIVSYTGAWARDVREGRGAQVFADGRVYDGAFVEDRIRGQGRLTYPDAGVYEGHMEEEGTPGRPCAPRRAGRGVHRYPDGGVFSGLWVNDKRHDRAGVTAAQGAALAVAAAVPDTGAVAVAAPRHDGVPSFADFVDATNEGTSSMQYADGAFYFGQFVEDRREGVGYMRSADGLVSFTGEFVRDRREGRGVWKDEIRGESYEGFFERDKMHGFGKQRSIDGSYYEGLFCYNLRHSPMKPARLVTKDGAIYVGRIDRTLRHDDKATFVNAAGDRYVGAFVEDVQTGKASIQWANGDTYEGDFVAAVPHGVGTKTCAEYSYTGEISQNLRHGRGEVRFRSGRKAGDKCTGTWVADILHGIGLYTYANGDVYDGAWVAEVREGQGSMRYATGELYAGGWRAALYHGSGTKTWVHGRIRSYSGEWCVLQLCTHVHPPFALPSATYGSPLLLQLVVSGCN